VAQACFPGTEEDPAGSYFVAAYPPFSAWKPAQVGAVNDILDRGAAARPLGIYVHLPFCEKKCDYCYYLSFTGRPRSSIAAYIDAVLEEVRLYAARPAIRNRDVSFVYLGGGTPSFLAPDMLRRLGLRLRDRLPWNGVREVTCECAPRSTRPETIEALRDIGVTRLSLGVQSFDDELLRQSGRIHRSADVESAFELVRQAGFACVNVDLMAGLPGETRDQWETSVRGAIALDPDSVTLYPTEMPHNTRMYDDYRSGLLVAPPVSWPEKRERLQHGFAALEQAGYAVVSGYAAVKDPRRHAFVYQEELWTGADMIGLGVASFSYVGGVHYQNAVTLDEHEAFVRCGELPIHRARALTPEERLVRELILGLKLGRVERGYFLAKFGTDIHERFRPQLRELERAGLLELHEDAVSLTRAGLLQVDRLLLCFYLEEHRGIRYS
jgi:oxygen-independent coproporphyrinogen-3 oxidase